MCRQNVWCYVFVLTLLEISLNTKLTALGKSHGVLHDALIEGITFQEWGGGEAGALGNGAGGPGGAGPALRMSPAALQFGRCALAEAHARRVTLTNTGNDTLHLASVSGTTPDFHASFFDTKTLAPGSNTSFSVVYFGRREGDAHAHLYVHTSHGVHKYAVSAWGAASSYRVWPTVAVRVPHNVTYSAPLRLHNPRARPLQVLEVYSSARWLRLSLPPAAPSAPASAWLVPPHATRELVTLHLHAPPPEPHGAQAHHAYIRIKLEGESSPLLVCVEVEGAEGVYAAPHVVYEHARGSGDPPARVLLQAGNAGPRAAAVAAWARVRCEGAGSVDASVTVTRSRPLAPHAPLAPVAALTLRWPALPAACGAEGCWRWCRGEVRLNSHSVPVVARVTPGTLALQPAALSVVPAAARAPHRLSATSRFLVPVHLTHLEVPPIVHDYFSVSEWHPRSLAPGEACAVVSLLPHEHAPTATLSSHLLLHTNISTYRVPLYLHTGKLHFEWDWWSPAEAGADGEGGLWLGAVPPSRTVRVSGRLHNPGPARVCVTELAADMADLLYLPCRHLAHDHPRRYQDSCWCLEGGARGQLSLTLVAPAREDEARGWLHARTAHAHTRAPLYLRACAGRLRAPVVALERCAPYSWCSGALVVESSVAGALALQRVDVHPPTAALTHTMKGMSGEISAGVQQVGALELAPERLCAPHCYTGLDLDSEEGREWMSRSLLADAESLLVEVEEMRARLAQYRAHASHTYNYSALLHTDQVVMTPVEVVASLVWPRLWAGPGAGQGQGAGQGAGVTAGVGGSAAVRVRVTNPSPSHALLLQPVLAALPASPFHGWSEEMDDTEVDADSGEEGTQVFSLSGWSGPAREVGGVPHAPLLHLPPRAALTLQYTFVPRRAALYRAPLYLRNNLTILEVVHLTGTGAYPRFKFGNRRPGSPAPLLFDLTERHLRDCASAPAPDATVKRAFTARNTGQVAVRVDGFRVGGRDCEGYGFKVLDCAPFLLEPNGSRQVEVAFTPDFTLSRVRRTLTLLSAPGAPANYTLVATVPAHLLAACGAAQPRPPWERHLRNAAVSLCLCVGLAVLAAATLDSDRILKRALAALTREPRSHLAPALDLRSLNHACLRPAPTAPAPAPAPTPAPPSPPATVARNRRRPPRTPRTEPLAPPVPPAPPSPQRPYAADTHTETSADTHTETSADMHIQTSADTHAETRADTHTETEADLDADEGCPLLGDDEDTSSTGTEGTDTSNMDEHDKEVSGIAEAATEKSATVEAEGAVEAAGAGAVRTAAWRARRDPPAPPAPPARPEPRPRTLAKPHAKRDKLPRRRPAPPIPSPAAAAPTAASPSAAAPAPPALPRSSPPASGLRWGTTFSEVVARSDSLYSAQLTPKKPEPPREASPAGAVGAAGTACAAGAAGAAGAGVFARDSDSLFFYNRTGEVGVIGQPAPTYTGTGLWAGAVSAPGASVGAVGTAVGPVGTGVGPVGGGVGPVGTGVGPVGGGVGPVGTGVGPVGGGVGPVGTGVGPVGTAAGPAGEEQASAAQWLWGGYGVKPPPGFPPQQQMCGVRAYDPFHALASIWSPGAADWRPPQPPQPTHPSHPQHPQQH